VIRTNDPSGSGGGIYVYAPYALIQNGSLIQATGIVSQAQVILSPGAVIHSTDRFNSVDVAGLYVDSGTVEDLTGATVVQVPVFVDSEKVLKGQCPSQAASGETSRLIDQLKGPYGGSIAPAPGRVSVSDASPAMAGCGAGR
jgi:hypothetical protein